MSIKFEEVKKECVELFVFAFYLILFSGNRDFRNMERFCMLFLMPEESAGLRFEQVLRRRHVDFEAKNLHFVVIGFVILKH